MSVLFTHPEPSKGTSRSNTEGTGTVSFNKTLNITSFNVEDVKGNMSTLINLAKNDSIICLQVTWLWTFEKSVLKNKIPRHEGFIRCSDLNENISNFQIPRGKGGIAIMWLKAWTNCVKKLDESNERIQAVKITTKEPRLCVVNVYLPTLRLPASKESYQENLDVIHNIIQQYSSTHKVIICGDFNGSLYELRSNPHDMMLNDFDGELIFLNIPVIVIPQPSSVIQGLYLRKTMFYHIVRQLSLGLA